MVREGDIYHQLVGVLTDYFGPATPRYIDRLVGSHLNKEPSSLCSADIPHLSQWIMRTTAVLTDDQKEIETLQERLRQLQTR